MSNTKVCKACGQELAEDRFERYATGTLRGVCRRCKYQLYGIDAKARWRRRQLAAHARI